MSKHVRRVVDTHTLDPELGRVTANTPDGGDIDLDQEVVLDVDGSRITNAAAEEYTRARAGGRPSLTAPGVRSPAVSFRVDPDTLAKVRSLAEQDGVSVSEFARRALLGAVGGR
jgi:hypothetical protein